MSSWEKCTLGDVLTLQRGFDLPKKKRVEGSVPVISSSGISGFHNESNGNVPCVVTGRYGTLGKVYYSENECWPLNTTLWVKDFKDNLPKYIYYLLQTVDFLQFSDKAAVPGVNRNHVHKAEVNLPPIKTQQAIAHILGTIDDKIDLSRRMNETLEAMAQAIFKSWFVDFDPVKAMAKGEQPVGMDAETASLFPDSFEPSELGEIPKGWGAGHLEDVLELAYGKALKKADRVEGQFPVYGSGGVTGSHHKALVDGPGIIVGRKGTVGKVYWEDRNFFPIDTVFFVKPKADYPLLFAFEILRSLGLENMNTDAAVPGLNRNNAYRLGVCLPEKRALSKYQSIASTFYEKRSSNLKQIESLIFIRDTLLPKLISGELSVSEVEKKLEAEL